MKCPKCGSEYFSSAPTCYACSRLEEASVDKIEVNWRRAIAILFGVILLVIGNLLILKGPDLVPDDQLSGFVNFSVFIISFGTVIVFFYFLHSKTSLKEFREGKEPSNRMAAIMLAVGLGMMVFIAYYLNAAYYFDITPRLFEALGLILPLSMLLIVVGLFRRPISLFRTEEVEMTASRRTIIGISTLMIGFVVQAATFAYGYWKSLDVLLVGWIWFLLIGPSVVILGIVILWGPMGRPWIPGEHRAQDEA